MENEIIYTDESGKDYTYREALEIAKGNSKLSSLMIYIADGKSLHTVFEDLLMEDEINENGELLYSDDY